MCGGRLISPIGNYIWHSNVTLQVNCICAKCSIVEQKLIWTSYELLMKCMLNITSIYMNLLWNRNKIPIALHEICMEIAECLLYLREIYFTLMKSCEFYVDCIWTLNENVCNYFFLQLASVVVTAPSPTWNTVDLLSLRCGDNNLRAIS